MLSGWKTPSGKTKLVQHPKLPFVYSYGKKQIGIEHLKSTRMNKGAMRQHVEGKLHKRNYDTGEPIMEQEIPKEILAQLELQKKESKAKSKPDSFDDLKRKLEFVLDDPEDVKDLLVRYGFDEMIKHDIQRKINGHETKKTAENYANYMVNLLKTDPSEALKLYKILLSSPTKTAESRHESPSKIPVLVPEDVRIVKTPKI